MIKTIIQYVLGLGLGGGLLYLAFKDFDWKLLQDALGQVSYLWLLVGLLASLSSHFVRALRWNLLLKASGYSPPIQNTFAALLVGYMANNAVPRLGEVSRCSILTRSNKVPFTTGAGTVLTERALDVIALALQVLIAFLLESSRLLSYFDKTEKSTTPFYQTIWFYTLIIGGILAGVVWLLRKRIAEITFVRAIIALVKNILQAAASIRNLREVRLFLVYTVLLWGLYTLATYLAFVAYPPTSELSFYFAWIVMTMTGIGMVIPVPGGVGPFHNAVIFTFIAFLGVSAADWGRILALFLHTSQLLMLVSLGAVSYFYLILQTPKSAEISS
ncbi:MAG: flippase-like domain-containing protein [Bacteroidia bacterium]|nr:flippase-like domain-containing protein [Bacteroidia bacterium]